MATNSRASYGAADTSSKPTPRESGQNGWRNEGSTRKESIESFLYRPLPGETDYLFKYLIITQIWMYLEAGAVPSLLEQFTRTFHLNPEQQGLLGAVVYMSISISSPWCSTLFRRFCPRQVLGWSLVVNNLALLCFAMAPTLKWYSKPLIIFLRAMIGCTQAFHCVYSPLWVHEYAPRSKRGTWMSFLQASVPLGITLGYFAGSVTVWLGSAAGAPASAADTLPLLDGNATDFAMNAFARMSASLPTSGALKLNLLGDVPTADSGLCHGIFCWRWPFLVQFFMVLPLSILIFFVPKNHIQIHTTTSTRKQSMVIYTGADGLSSDDVEGSAHSASEATLLTQSPPHASPTTQRRHLVRQEARMWDSLMELFEQRVFVCIVLGLSALFFVVAGVQFWTTLYLSTNTNDSVYEIHTAYLLVSGTGPVLGVFFGGWLIDQFGGYAGPYQQAKALRICMVLGFIGCVSSIPVTFVHSTLFIAIFLWVMLFFGGCLLPACSGIVISSAPPRLRPLASSVAYTSYNLLGYAASNYLPGLIMNVIVRNHGDGPDSCDVACTYRIGFRIVLSWSIWAFCCLVGGTYYSEKKRAEVMEEEARTGIRPTSGSIV